VTDPMLGRRRPAEEAAMVKRLEGRAWQWVTGPFVALDFSFSVRAEDPAIGEFLELALAPLGGAPGARHTYSVVDHGPGRRQRYVVYLDGRYITRTAGQTAAAVYVLWHVNRSVVRESSRYVLVHAAAAVRDGRAVLLPAAMESGKTTLVAGLLRRGLDYLTDEALGIDTGSGLAHPYPKSLSVDPGSWEVLADLEPSLPGHLALFAITQWQVDPRNVRRDVISGPCPIGTVITPRYQEGAATELLPISRAEGLALLVENAFNFATHGAAGLDALAAALETAECYRLTFGSLDEACDAVLSVS